MRILAIRGEHLASLHERFEVDFRKEPLAGVGLFAIVGATGAGKSTLLDAACLALYGETPRTRGSGGVRVGLESDAERLPSKDPRSLLSRGCRSGFAEVEFRALDGEDYRARWCVRVPPRKAALGEAEMSVVRIAGEQVLADKVNLARKTIEALVGFTFEEFQKAVLLPQGEFAEFLKADAASRAAILEKVAGGRLYSKIGELVGKRRKDADDELARIEAEAAACRPLAPDARATAEAASDAAQAELETLRVRARQAEAALAWYERSDTLVTELRRAEAAHAAAEEQVAAAAPRRAAAEAAGRALTEASSLAAATAAEAKLRDAVATVEQLGAALQRARSVELNAREAAGAATAALASLEEEERRTRPELDEAMRLDARVVEANRLVGEHQKTAQASEEALRLALEAVRGHERTAAALRMDRDAAEAWLAARAGEAAVVSEWPRWRDVAERLVTALRAAEVVRQRLATAPTQEGVAAAWKDVTDAKRLAEEARRAAADAETQLGVASAREREANARAQEARVAFDRARDVQGLESRRAELREGDPCPLCGSKTHPYSGDARLDLVVRDAELRAREVAAFAAECVAAREQAATVYGDARSHAAASEANARSREEAAKRLEEALERAGRDAAERELRSLQQQASGCDAALAVPFERVAGWATALREAPATFLARWDSAATEHRERRAKLDTLQAQLGVCERDLAIARSVAEERGTAAADATRAVAQARAAADERARERTRLLAGRGTREVADELALRRENAVRAVNASAAEADRAARTLATASGQHDQAQKSAAHAQSAAAAAALELAAALDRLKMTREELAQHVARGARFVDAERAALAQLDRAVDQRRGELTACAKALEAHRATGAPLRDRPDTTAELARAREGEVAAERRHVDALAMLRADDEARRALAAVAPRLDAARSRADVWGKLHELIGQSGQASYRTFVQGLALESLVAQANQHLGQLAPRYRLLRVPGTDMDLQVLDRDQADAVRAVNSLSGGETFLVSLALALGLSALSSRAARVESLFVDEGFGSLDPETLDVAMGVLESLQSTGRTVGIISHVTDLEERIGVLVRVEKMGGGRSRVIAERTS